MSLRPMWLTVMLLALAIGCAPHAAFAAGPSGGAGHSDGRTGGEAQPGDSAPAQQIAAMNAGLLQVMKTGRSVPFAQRVAVLTPIVQKVFDLKLILQNSVGPARWPSIPEAQKTQLMQVFTEFTVASYVANFDTFSGETFSIAPELRHVGRDTVVQTRIQGSAGDPTRLDYVMRETEGGWHVVDILLDGSISRVAVTRSDFRSLLGQSDAAALIDSLRSKVATLIAGNTP